MKLTTKLVGFVAFATMAISAGFSTVAQADSIYTVKPGDTLSGIAISLKGNVNAMNEIAQTNHIQNLDLIYVGQKLNISDNGTITEATPAQVQQNTEVNTVEESAPVQQQAQPQQQTQAAPTDSNSAKEWIAQRESSGSYDARNGRYIGRYQLDSSYLNGDYSPANQERVADAYVQSRYGSWEAAKAFWEANGWY